jgi:hypothetical protein
VKALFLIFISIHFLIFTAVGFKDTHFGIGPISSQSCDSVPALNKEIIAFVKSKVNKKVGRGECWDLAAEALKTTEAVWDKNYKFGLEVNYKKDCVFEGDIIQFEGVMIKYKKGNTFYVEELGHHTAIIYEVKAKGEYVLAEQNTNQLGKKVGFSTLELENITKGKFKIFRPSK